MTEDCGQSMLKVERFEDLIAWQKARELSRPVHEITRQNTFAKDFGLSSQIQRTAVSNISNIAKGFECGGHGEFHKLLSIAKASCARLRSQQYVALDVGYRDKANVDQQMKKTEKVARILGGFCAVDNKQRKGQKG